MRVGVIAHGALLVAALGFGYQTWTREKTEKPKTGTITVWDQGLGSFEAFAYDGDNKSIRVEKRKDKDGDYLWGQVTRSKKPPKAKVPVKSEPANPPAEDPHGGHAPPGMPPGMPPGAPGAKTPAPAAPKTPAPAAPKTPAPAKTAPAGGAVKAPQSPHHSQPSHPGADDDDDGGDDGQVDTGDDPTAGGSSSATEEELITTTREFPIGADGAKLVENLAHLRALRDLGKVSDEQKKEFELEDSKENLTVFFAGGVQRSLIVGGRVFGGSDRYVLDTDSGKGYVLSNSEIMRHIDSAETSLGLKVLHRFQEDVEEPVTNPADPKAPRPKKDMYPGVAKIAVETPSGSRQLVRAQSTDPKGNAVSGWTSADKPGPPDLTFANFLGQVERLKPTEYDTNLNASTLTRVLTIQYEKDGGGGLGTFELYKREKVSPEVSPSVGPTVEEEKPAETTEYYVHTELTRVLGKVSKMAAERVEGDVGQLFGAKPKEPPKGAKPPGKPGVAPPVKPVLKPDPAPKATPPKPAGSPAPTTPGNK